MSGRIKMNSVKASGKINTSGNRKALTECGRVAIGEKRQNNGGFEYPVSTDYFVIKGGFESLVYAKYGPQPKELPIFFYSDDFKEVCNERLELRDNTGRLWGEGDGENFMIWSPKVQDHVPCTTEQRPDLMDAMVDLVTKDLSKELAKYIEWKQVLTIRFIIKDIPVLGYWQFSTKAVKTTIPNLRDKFDECLSMFKTVRFFPFKMTIKKVKSNKPGDMRQYPVVDILPAFSMETGLQLSQYIQQNEGFNQAQIALMDLNDLKQDSNVKLLLKGGQ